MPGRSAAIGATWRSAWASDHPIYLPHRNLYLRQVVLGIAAEYHAWPFQIDLPAGKLRLQAFSVQVCEKAFIALPQFRVGAAVNQRYERSSRKLLNEKIAGYPRRPGSQRETGLDVGILVFVFGVVVQVH